MVSKKKIIKLSTAELIGGIVPEKNESRKQILREEVDGVKFGSHMNDYSALKYLVQGGFSAVYKDEIKDFLNKIYSSKYVDRLDENGELMDKYSELLADAGYKYLNR